MRRMFGGRFFGGPWGRAGAAPQRASAADRSSTRLRGMICPPNRERERGTGPAREAVVTCSIWRRAIGPDGTIVILRMAIRFRETGWPASGLYLLGADPQCRYHRAGHL